MRWALIRHRLADVTLAEWGILVSGAILAFTAVWMVLNP